MLFWINILFLLFFALLFSSVLAYGFGWRHPSQEQSAGPPLLFLFMIFLFVMWAGSVWFRPMGPIAWGIPWVSLLVVGFFLSLILLAVAIPSRRPPRTAREAAAEAEEAAAEGRTFGVFFWIFLVTILAVSLAGYLLE